MSQSPDAHPAALAARLAGARNLIEGKFLDAGVALETATEVIGGLIASLDGLAKLLDARTVDEATGALSGAAARLNGLADTHQDRRERVRQLAATDTALETRIVEMRRTLSYLRTFATSIKITAGGIPGAYAEFEDFSQDIRDAIAEGSSQLDEFRDELAGLSRQVETAMKLEAELEGRCSALLPAVPNRLDADATAIAAHQGRIANLAADAGGLARRIQNEVLGALGALQVGDITRQRIEHVETALDLLQARPMDPAARAALTPVVHAMLAAQLHDSAQGFSTDVDRIVAGLHSVATDAAEILRLCAVARGEGDERKGGVLNRLDASLAEAMGLVTEVETAEQSARSIARSAEEMAAGLTRRIESIRDIKSTIHRMATNAHLKCYRMGEAGRPLSVISIELRVHAIELDEAAGRTETALAALAPDTALATDADAAPLTSAAIGDLLRSAAAPIRLAVEQSEADTASLAGRGSAVIDTLRQATARLNVQADVDGVLLSVADQLSEGTEMELDDAASAALAELMAEIGRHYTMASERNIHAAYLPIADARAAA